MSKFWLLLLLVAAVQYAHAYPSEYELEDTDFASDEVELDDYLEDEQTTWGILKEAWGKIKDRYKKISKEKMQKIIALLNDKFCSQQNDFEDDFESDEAEDSVSKQYKIVQQIKELFAKAKAKWGQQKDKLKEEIAKIKAKFCAKLKEVAEDSDFFDDDGDDEERGIKWGKLGSKLGKGLKKAGKKIVKGLKKLKGPMKKLAKKGLEIIKKAGIKVKPLQCEGKTCKSCIIIRIPMEMSFCLQMGFMKTNKATYLTIALTKDDVPKFEHRLKLGEMPRCLNVGGAIGKICLKGLEGQAKSSSGQANVNFCLAVLAENFGVGCKFCASYENKKLHVKFEPKTFPGATDESGDMVELSPNGEDGVELAADEFEVE